MPDLEPLLVVQEHDSAVDHLRHRRATLPEREALAAAEAEMAQLQPGLTDLHEQRDALARDVKRLEDEATSVAAHAAKVEKAMYSGSVTSPRELQAMQADVEQLQRHQGVLEDRELELMERQEALDAELAALERRADAARSVAATARETMVVEETAIDEELARELAARQAAAAAITPELLALYERCRERARGVGVARLVGNTCQGCRLTIPATEVDRIRHQGPEAPVSHCDNCGAILVP